MAVLPQRVDVRTHAKRKALCAACPYRAPGVCRRCWCPLALKIPFVGQSCPAGKW